MVIVHVNHAGSRRGLPGHLMHVPGRGNAGADVDELRYPRLAGQEPHRPLHERAVGPRDGAYFRKGAQDLADGFPVSGIVVPAAQIGVIHAGRMRPTRIDLRSGETGLLHCILPARHGHGQSSACTRCRQAGRLQSRTLQDTVASSLAMHAGASIWRPPASYEEFAQPQAPGLAFHGPRAGF
jgi:hypothetical protein